MKIFEKECKSKGKPVPKMRSSSIEDSKMLNIQVRIMLQTGARRTVKSAR